MEYSYSEREQKGGAMAGAKLARRYEAKALGHEPALGLSEVAAYLQDHLGQKLTAFVAGVSDPKTVGRWASGKSGPPFHREVRLRSAYDAARLIVDQVGDETARAWFLGTSPFLDHTAPAVVLHDAKTPEGCRHIVPAARSFLEGAY
jgi:hypothetical protein